MSKFELFERENLRYDSFSVVSLTSNPKQPFFSEAKLRRRRLRHQSTPHSFIRPHRHNFTTELSCTGHQSFKAMLTSSTSRIVLRTANGIGGKTALKGLIARGVSAPPSSSYSSLTSKTKVRLLFETNVV
jgi:hypothetical protein